MTAGSKEPGTASRARRFVAPTTTHCLLRFFFLSFGSSRSEESGSHSRTRGMTKEAGGATRRGERFAFEGLLDAHLGRMRELARRPVGPRSSLGRVVERKARRSRPTSSSAGPTLSCLVLVPLTLEP
mgnify:CR=1 FL=1